MWPRRLVGSRTRSKESGRGPDSKMGFGGSHLVADVLISTEAFVFHQKKSESREVEVWFEDAGPSSVGCGRRAENPWVRVVMLRFCCILERGSSSSTSASQPAGK